MAYAIDLSGKVALVTGASRGIGLACAEILAASGARVVLNAAPSAADPEALTRLAADMTARHGVSCLALAADAADARAVAALYQELFRQTRRLDILVANAGVMENAMLGMISGDSMRRTLGVNVEGVLNHLQMATRLLRRNAEGGSVVATSSIVGVRGNAGQALYAASKAAVIGAVLSAARELAADGIRVNAVAPGFIDTAMTASLAPEVKARLLGQVGMKRIGTPEDVARAVLFLVSDLAAYVTGQVLGVDGGMTL